MQTYNTAHFSDEVVANNDHKISMVLQCEELVLDSLKMFLVSTKNYEQTDNFTPFIHLAVKMRFNLDSAHQLLQLLKSDYRFKTSINILYRSCLDDTINLYYLLGFVVVDNATKMPSALQPSLGNELDILHREFLKSTAIIIESEQDTARYYKELSGETYVTPQESNWRKDMVDENLHLYNETEKRWKNNKEIRTSSSPLFANLFPSGNGKVPESGKMEFIRNKGFARSPS